MAYLQYLQLHQALEGVLVEAGDLVVVQLKAPEGLGALEDAPAHRDDGIVGDVPADPRRKQFSIEGMGGGYGSVDYCRLLWSITYNRKRLAELVTKFSGIAFSRLLFRRLSGIGLVFSLVWYVWCGVGH